MPTTDHERAIERRYGERVRDLRTAAGLSQAVLAEKLGQAGGPSMNHSNLAKLERGTRGVGLGEAFLLARVLGTTLSAVLGDDDALAAEAEAIAAEREAAELSARAAEARERARAARSRRGTVSGVPLTDEDAVRAAADQQVMRERIDAGRDPITGEPVPEQDGD